MGASDAERPGERADMVDRLVADTPGLSEESQTALRRVQRHRFVPELFAALAYSDTPVPIGRAHTLPAPATVAKILAAANVRAGERVLIVGNGTGYLTALFAEVGATVFVAEGAAEFLRRHRSFFEAYPTVSRRLGIAFDTWEEAAPFDAVIIHGAVDAVPAALSEQLGGRGRMVVPLADASGMQILARIGLEGSRVSVETLGQSFFGWLRLDEQAGGAGGTGAD